MEQIYKGKLTQKYRKDPYIVFSDGAKKWYCDGQLHRINGPAIIYEDGIEEWWLHDQKYTKDQYEEEMKRRKELARWVYKKWHSATYNPFTERGRERITKQYLAICQDHNIFLKN